MVISKMQLIFANILFCSIGGMVMMSANALGINKTALFVFGDSVADTGNHLNDSNFSGMVQPWQFPYGITWPGFPDGHYSDGRVFTEFYATYLGVVNPIPYRQLQQSILRKPIPNGIGINFAFGGSGVFLTISSYPNVSTQITQLQQTIKDGFITNDTIGASIALITVNGNDYSKYWQDDGAILAIPAFVRKVVDQIGIAATALRDLGFKNLSISNMELVGCLPFATKSSNYSSCDAAYNFLAILHNILLESKIKALKIQFPDVTFNKIDFFQAYSVTLLGGTSSLASKLRPCCDGKGDAKCGSVDSSGNPLYTLCASPTQSFFWDGAHLTDVGWQSVSAVLFQ